MDRRSEQDIRGICANKGTDATTFELMFTVQCQGHSMTHAPLPDPQKDPMKKKQICVTDKTHRTDIIALFKVHLHWHPFIFTGADETYDVTVDMRMNWTNQVIEMHNLCQILEESWAWEYLWKNWYRPDRWHIWARAVSKEIPIVNSNGLVEALWATFKRRYLRRYARPRLEFMIQILMDDYLPNRVRLVKAHRTLQADAVW
jgi:hypothetical protein